MLVDAVEAGLCEVVSLVESLVDWVELESVVVVPSVVDRVELVLVVVVPSVVD